jgi:hypothetical protein
MKSTYEELGTLSILQESTDAGQTWTNDEKALFDVLARQGLPGVIARGIPSEVRRLVVDSADPRILYAAVGRGVLRSSDRGLTWSQHEAGMAIPLVRSLVQPPSDTRLFAGTPGGLYLSQDGGRVWQDGNLWLQFTKNTRRELGGASLLDAYWRARYHGFIDAATADAVGSKPQMGAADRVE